MGNRALRDEVGQRRPLDEFHHDFRGAEASAGSERHEQ